MFFENHILCRADDNCWRELFDIEQSCCFNNVSFDESLRAEACYGRCGNCDADCLVCLDRKRCCTNRCNSSLNRDETPCVLRTRREKIDDAWFWRRSGCYAHPDIGFFHLELRTVVSDGECSIYLNGRSERWDM